MGWKHKEQVLRFTHMPRKEARFNRCVKNSRFEDTRLTRRLWVTSSRVLQSLVLFYRVSHGGNLAHVNCFCLNCLRRKLIDSCNVGSNSGDFSVGPFDLWPPQGCQRKGTINKWQFAGTECETIIFPLQSQWDRLIGWMKLHWSGHSMLSQSPHWLIEPALLR